MNRESFEAALKKDVYDEVTHKVFADWLSENGFDEEAEYHYTWTKEKQEAIDWIHEWEDKLNLSKGQLLWTKPEDAYEIISVGDAENERNEFCEYRREEFLRKLELATGLRFTEDNEPHIWFSCGC